MRESDDVTTEGTREGDEPGTVVVRGRVVYSRGPLIHGLIAFTVVVGLAAVAALAFSLSVFSDQLGTQRQQIETIQTARERSAFDGCRIDQAVILRSAANGRPRYPVRNLHGDLIGYLYTGSLAKREAKARMFLVQVNLNDCHRYAVLVRTGKLPPLPSLVGGKRGRR